MRVVPGNQTLILAGEPGGRAAKPAGGGQSAAGDLPPGVLQRITVIAARPDDTLLYLRADYTSQDDTPEFQPPRPGWLAVEDASRAAETAAQAQAANPDPIPSPAGAGTAVTARTLPTHVLAPTRALGLYARTQHILDPEAPRLAHIDVHA